MEEPFEKPLSGETFQALSDLVYQHSRIRLGADKRAFVANRLRRRLRVLALRSYEEYCRVLHSPHGADEIEELVDLISINHTRFYREPEHFAFLTQRALPALVRPLAATHAPLRLWSAASSSGEEPYTMAIVVAEFLWAHAGVAWEIMATDISHRVLADAREGIYSMASVKPVPLELLKRYFQKGVGARDGVCRVKPELRRHLRFERVNLFQEHLPVPVVVVSSLTPAGSAKAMEALKAGALDVIGKPGGGRSLAEIARELVSHVKAVGRSRRVARRALPASEAVPSSAPAFGTGRFSPRRLIAIGASTGGVEALRYLLPRLPDGLPPIVVVQHIPANFSRIMAEHLDALCAFTVREAEDGDELRPGLCLVAPGDSHLALGRSGFGYRVRLTQSPPVHHCRPSVDILFRSAAEQAGEHAVAALLTGMGVDGAHGLQLLRAAGARTLAEAEESCVVFGMPQAAIKLEAAEQIVPLPRIPQAILKMLSQPVRKGI